MNPSDKCDLVNILATQVGEYLKPTEADETGYLKITFEDRENIILRYDGYKISIDGCGLTKREISWSDKGRTGFRRYMKMLFNDLYIRHFCCIENNDVSLELDFNDGVDEFQIWEENIYYCFEDDMFFSGYLKEFISRIELAIKEYLLDDTEETDDSDEEA